MGVGFSANTRTWSLVFRRIHKVHKASGRLSCFALLAVFAVFPGKLSAINASFSAEILDRRRFGEQKNSKARCCFPLFLWINRTVAKVALLWQQFRRSA
jgi:hypothetical protein